MALARLNGMARWTGLLAAGVLALALAACADEPERGTPPPEGPPATTSTPGLSDVPPPTMSPPAGPPKSPSDTVPTTTYVLRGRVGEAEVPTCRRLHADDGKTYVLFGGDPDVLKIGTYVEVHVRYGPVPRIWCGEGTPVKVVTAVSLPR